MSVKLEAILPINIIIIVGFHCGGFGGSPGGRHGRARGRGGAAAGGGALFLVDRLIGDRVSRFASVHYRVEGPVKEPRITFVKPFEKSR